MHECDEERRRADHEGDVLAFDQRRARARDPSVASSTLRKGSTPGTSTALSKPDDVRERCRHQHRVAAAQPVRVDHDPGLVRQAALGVQRGLRLAGGSRGEQHDGEIDSGARRSDLLTRTRVVSSAKRASRPRTSCGDNHTLGSTIASMLVDVAVAGLMVDRRGDRTEAPARAVEQHHFVPVRGLPRHHVAAPHTRGAQATRERGDSVSSSPPLDRTPVDSSTTRSRRARLGRRRHTARRATECPTARRVVGSRACAACGTSTGASRVRAQSSGLRQPALTVVAPRNTCVPTKLRWISTVPAPMHRPRMSRYMRSTGYSR